MSDDDQPKAPGPRILKVPTDAVEAEVVFSAEPSEPPLDGKAQRLARAIGADLLLYNAAAFEAYRGGPLPGDLDASIREGYGLFAERSGPGHAHGFAAVLAELAAERRLAIDTATIVAALGPSAGTPQASPTSAEPRELRLVVRHGVEQGKTFVVQGTEATVGRVQECTICLPSASLSRRHAVLMVKEGGWTVADLSSANGTSVNGRSAESFVRVRVGDRLRFGDVECEVLDASAGGTGTPHAARKPWWKLW